MSRASSSIIDIYGGISIAKKIGPNGSFRFGKSLNIHDDPNDLTLQLAGRKVSGSVVTGLIKWIEDGTPYNDKRYAYDADGKIYQEDVTRAWSVLQTTANAKGQGLAIHDDYLYYTQNNQLGRYGPLSGAATFDDDWQTGLSDTGSTGFAPILTFKEGFAVGHGNKVAWWDGAVWTPEALVLPAELNVRSITKTDQYIVIGAWRGNSVTDSEDSYIFSWDTLSDTFNDFAPADGGINAMSYSRNKLLSIQGHQGYIYTDSTPFNKVHQIPRVSATEYVDVYAGAITVWKGMTHFGTSDSSSTSDMRGVYSFGAKSQLFPDALNLEFGISTGGTGSNVHIGAVKGFGNELYIAWQDGATYGVDLVSNTSTYATSGVYESLIEDDKRPADGKSAVVVEVGHLPLAEDESITIKYKIDRAASWSSGDNSVTNTTEGSMSTKLHINKQFKEFEWQTTLVGPGTSTPTVVQQEFTYDKQEEQRKE